MHYWIITDTHYGHRKLEEYSGRPSDFEVRIFNNCMKVILPEDIVIHLGDVCMGRDLEMIEKYWIPIPGKKILVKGNHDKKSNTWYQAHGFDFVCESFGLNYLGNRILFSHAPRENIHGYNLNIHGHWHNNDHRKGPEVMKFYTPFHKLLAIEFTNYQPILLETFLKNEKAKDKNN